MVYFYSIQGENIDFFRMKKELSSGLCNGLRTYIRHTHRSRIDSIA